MAKTDAKNANFKATIGLISKELTARERIMLKDTTDAIKLDEATQETDGGILVALSHYAVLDIHNEKSDTTDYKNYILVDTDGQKYVTGSESFYRAFTDIIDELTDAGEPVEGTTFKIYRHPSKNYSGKDFITCGLA